MGSRSFRLLQTRNRSRQRHRAGLRQVVRRSRGSVMRPNELLAIRSDRANQLDVPRAAARDAVEPRQRDFHGDGISTVKSGADSVPRGRGGGGGGIGIFRSVGRCSETIETSTRTTGPEIDADAVAGADLLSAKRRNARRGIFRRSRCARRCLQRLSFPHLCTRVARTQRDRSWFRRHLGPSTVRSLRSERRGTVPRRMRALHLPRRALLPARCLEFSR